MVPFPLQVYTMATVHAVNFGKDAAIAIIPFHNIYSNMFGNCTLIVCVLTTLLLVPVQ